MKRRGVLGALAAFALLAPPAFGQAALAGVVGQLEAQGYEIVEVRRTLLGRIRVEAVSSRNRREVVFDRGTGEVLRDLVRPLVGDDRRDRRHHERRESGPTANRGGSGNDAQRRRQRRPRRRR